MKWTRTWKLNNPKEGRGGRLHPPEQEACLSLFYLNNSWKFFAGNALLLARPSITGRHLHHHHLDYCTCGLHILSRGHDGSPLGEVGRGGRLSGGKNAEEKWMWPWASTSTWTVRRVSPRGFSSRRKRERGSRHFIDPWNRSTTKILSNTSSTG